MMKALTCAALLTLSGCATVSMVSTDAIVESECSVESSELAEAATAFNTRAEARGWVGEPRGLMDFAKVLLGGGSEDGGTTAGTYADQISAANAPVTDVFQTIIADSNAAQTAFSEVDTLARTLLGSDDVMRSDLIAFERALVTAQKSYRGFSEAAGIAAEREKTGLEAAETALAAYAGTIDAARQTADDLADAYADAGKKQGEAAS